MNTRTDTASKVIKAAPATIYQAFLTPEAIATWRPPKGMSCRIYAFGAVEGSVLLKVLCSFGYAHVIWNTAQGICRKHLMQYIWASKQPAGPHPGKLSTGTGQLL